MGSFASLGVAAPLVQALEEGGIGAPFAIQQLTIADALAGRDVCAKAQTGSGKTLAFGVPLIQSCQASTGATRAKGPRGLVLVPTRELAVQVVEVLAPLAESMGLKVVAVYGGANLERQVKRSREATIVVATPGRLIDLLGRNEIALTAVETLVLDEADRMVDMGFLPQVEWILRHTGKGDHRPQMLLFSATLDGAIDALVRRYLTDPVYHAVADEAPTVDAMTHRFLRVHQMDRVKVAAAIGRTAYRTLMFVRTKRGADRLATQLQREGVKAAAIHGDLRQTARERALRDFTDGHLPVLVATDVAARGIHVDEIDVVIHYDPPEDHKAYVHRSGRTARAGQSGTVVTFVLWNQELEVERLQKRLGLREPIIEVFSNDPRLADLASIELEGVAAS